VSIANYLKSRAFSEIKIMELKKINENTWQIKKQGGMKVPAIIYASEKLIQKIKEDKTLEQARNVACLKGIQRAAYVMPDAHQGYHFSIKLS